jgi:hypothetical protein
VTYSELRPERAKPGVITFGRINALATNFHHVDGRRTRDDRLSLTIESYVQDTGRYVATFDVPLDAPGYELTYRGTVGPMPISAINALTAYLFPVRVTAGQLRGIDYDVRVAGGTANGSITPRYTGLAVTMTEEGGSGILGSGGVVGDAARGIALFFARRGIHEDNPAADDSAARKGSVTHSARPIETLPSFLWHGLRTGLADAVRK